MSIDLKDKNILVTGSNGFLGTHLCNKLQGMGATVYSLPHTKDPNNGADLLIQEECWNVFANMMVWTENRIDYVFHLAGYNGGIQFNLDRPADIFLQNTQMALNVLEQCRIRTVGKVLSVVASCAYPAYEYFDDDYDLYGWRDKEVMKENDFLEGPPHDSVAGHAYAKRNIQLASYFLNRQYGLNAVCACPTTLYGPGDSMDPQRTKVMGALIKKFADAKKNEQESVTCWGTGAAQREFLYVEDAAELLVQTMLKYDDSSMPLNLGTGQEFSIKKVAEMVAASVGFNGRIEWDTSKPDGQLRKRLDLTRMKSVLGDFPFTPIEEGIRKTVEWYRS